MVDFNDLMPPGYTGVDGWGSRGAKLHSYLIVLMPTGPVPVRYLRKNMVLQTLNTALTKLQPMEISVANMLHQKKTPDLAWTPCINNTPNDYPSVVLEYGYSESNTQLMRDSLVWLQGTDGAVKVVVLCKTFPPGKDNKIRATLSICKRMHNGQIIQDQWVIYFPFHQRALYLESNLVFPNLVCLPHSGR